MNENINLCEILKDCPKGTKLYSSIFGEVEFQEVTKGNEYPIVVSTNNIIDEEREQVKFASDGKFWENMELNYYQEEAHKTSLHEMPVIYPALGLAGEAGEVADKIKKLIRDEGYKPGDRISTIDKVAIMHELGDVLWYVAELAHNLGITLEEVGRQNLQKLASRQQRNKIHGSGDER